jgi:hypothetical protein
VGRSARDDPRVGCCSRGAMQEGPAIAVLGYAGAERGEDAGVACHERPETRCGYHAGSQGQDAADDPATACPEFAAPLVLHRVTAIPPRPAATRPPSTGVPWDGTHAAYRLRRPFTSNEMGAAGLGRASVRRAVPVLGTAFWRAVHHGQPLHSRRSGQQHAHREVWLEAISPVHRRGLGVAAA